MRYGFTLIELLVSIILFSLIATFLYGGIDQVRAMSLFYDEKGKRFSHHEQLRSLLYRDLAQTDTLRLLLQDNDHTLAFLEPTRHSLYKIDHPYVAWLIMQKGNSLIRLESAEPIHLPIDPAKLYGIHKDTIATDCTTFRLYESATGRFATLLCKEETILIETLR